jgi:general secretion pathway protein G
VSGFYIRNQRRAPDDEIHRDWWIGFIHTINIATLNLSLIHSQKPYLIVFAAIGILLAFLSDRMRNIESYRKSAVVVHDLISFSSALAMYRLNCGELPSAADGLSALVSRPSSLSPNKRWVQIMHEVPLDPWGIPYVYEVLNEGKKMKVRIHSKNSDRSNPMELLELTLDKTTPSSFIAVERADQGKSPTQSFAK